MKPVLEERLALLVVLAIALWSALATFGTFAALSFRALCLVYSVALVLAVLVLAWRWSASRHRGDEPSRESSAHRWLLLGFCLLGSALAFVDHRPNLDDGYYFSGRTIHYLAHPDALLDLEHHNHALLDWPVHYPLLLLQPVSLLWSYVGFVSGLSGLDVLHYVVPVLGGFLLPLAWFLALSRFVRSPLAAVTGTAAILTLLCLDGVTMRSFGSFGFPLIRMGKGMLTCVFIPIFIAFSKDWFEHPGRRNFAKLFLLTIACAGLSDSSLFLLPVLAAFLAAGALVARGLSSDTLRLLTGYFASLAWLYGIGAYILAVFDRSQIALLGFAIGFPSSFWGQLTLVFGNPPGPFLWVYVAALPLAWLGIRERAQRAFLAGWLIAAVALLNPLLLPVVTGYLTSYSAYWRLFHLLPFMLALGIAFAQAVTHVARARTSRYVLASALLLSIAALGNLYEPASKTAVFSRVPLRLTGYKIDPDVQKAVRSILARAEPGPMLSPPFLSAVIPLFTDEHPQVAVRGFMLSHTAIANGDPELAVSRLRAVRLLSGQAAPGAKRDLEQLLARQELRNVVISAPMGARPGMSGLLRRYGFRKAVIGPRLWLFVRPLEPDSSSS